MTAAIDWTQTYTERLGRERIDIDFSVGYAALAKRRIVCAAPMLTTVIDSLC